MRTGWWLTPSQGSGRMTRVRPPRSGSAATTIIASDDSSAEM